MCIHHWNVVNVSHNGVTSSLTVDVPPIGSYPYKRSGEAVVDWAGLGYAGLFAAQSLLLDYFPILISYLG